MQQLSIASLHQLRRWFWSLLVGNALFIAGVALYLRPLTSGQVVRFELAKHTPVAESIIQEWTSNGLLQKAITSVYIDFFFIVLYVAGLGITSIFLSKLTMHEILIRTGKFFSYLMVAAGICDVIENVSLLKMLYGNVNYWNVVVAYDMAATKFSLVILCILFIGICIIFWGLGKLTKS